ncbi:MAG: transcriptional regulator, partial [Hyphomicrobiaceae bacterium]|nr:transcriptional regulator [Hyphomicrobiaceae bacterium]
AVPVQYFYEELPAGVAESGVAGFGERPSENYTVEFLGSREGLELNKAFARIGDLRIRRAIVELIRSLASENANS